LPTAWELTVTPASMAAAAMGPTIGNSGMTASGIFGAITAAITLTSPYTDATRTSAARRTDPASATGPPSSPAATPTLPHQMSIAARRLRPAPEGRQSGVARTER